MGIQFIASKGRDNLLVQVAKLFEDHDQLMMLHPTIKCKHTITNRI